MLKYQTDTANPLILNGNDMLYEKKQKNARVCKSDALSCNQKLQNFPNCRTRAAMCQSQKNVPDLMTRSTAMLMMFLGPNRVTSLLMSNWSPKGQSIVTFSTRGVDAKVLWYKRHHNFQLLLHCVAVHWTGPGVCGEYEGLWRSILRALVWHHSRQ